MIPQNTANTLARERYLEYFEPGCAQRLLAMCRDLRKPRSSPERRVAVAELRRLSAQAASMLMTLLALSPLLLVDTEPPRPEIFYTAQWTDLAKPARPPAAEETPPAESVPETPPAEAASLDSAALVAVNAAVAAAADAAGAPFSAEATTPRQAASPLTATLDKPAPVRSITGVFKPLSGESRGAAARGLWIGRNGGDPLTEDAVLKALRWLKKNQQADGSWKAQKIAMTGLAVLTFLAHDERPGASPEFGGAVQKALDFLMASQKPDGRFSGADGNEYAHPIATYALCEAYGMTLNPNVKAAAEKALVPILRGQHPTGGWTYKLDPGVSAEDGRYRDDTSYMGWCAQALKAAKLAQLRAEGLDKAVKLAVKGFQKNAGPNGGFGYTAPGQGGLTGVGTLCLQLLGAAGAPEVRKSLALMESWKPSFEAKTPAGGSTQYACYYATQAKFHAGGKQWDDWNKEMAALYLKSQQIEKGAVKDAKGRDADIGWWVNGDAHTDRPVMDTCLAALQLMVYYRNLPTTTAEAIQAPKELLLAQPEKGDVTVLLRNL